MGELKTIEIFTWFPCRECTMPSSTHWLRSNPCASRKRLADPSISNSPSGISRMLKEVQVNNNGSQDSGYGLMKFSDDLKHEIPRLKGTRSKNNIQRSIK